MCICIYVYFVFFIILSVKSPHKRKSKNQEKITHGTNLRKRKQKEISSNGYTEINYDKKTENLTSYGYYSVTDGEHSTLRTNYIYKMP